jgi:hypothetical protein
MDTNYDGKPDVWEIYDEGKLERRGVDLDFDGHVDRWDRDEIALREIEAKEAKDAQVSDGGAAPPPVPPTASTAPSTKKK